MCLLFVAHCKPMCQLPRWVSFAFQAGREIMGISLGDKGVW